MVWYQKLNTEDRVICTSARGNKTLVMSHGGQSIAGIVSRRCHSPPLLQLRTISDTWMLNAHVRHDHFPEREPLGAKSQFICCSVVAM